MAQGPLVDAALTDTPQKRQQLSYLVRCALSPGQQLQSAVRGVLYTFKGEIGLAPGWTDRGLTPSEQRWVSACMLAHVNDFGKHVRILLEARFAAPVPFLKASRKDRARFSIHEGAFFGNLFLGAPVAFACEGRKSEVQQADRVLRDRVCTRPAGRTARGMPVSACGFVVTGECGEPWALAGGGHEYKEVIAVYLQPAAR